MEALLRPADSDQDMTTGHPPCSHSPYILCPLLALAHAANVIAQLQMSPTTSTIVYTSPRSASNAIQQVWHCSQTAAAAAAT